MKNKFLILGFLLLFSLTFISAEDFGYNYLEGDLDIARAINYTQVNVNNSIYWDNNAWSDTRWLNIDGSNANQNIDISTYDFTTTGSGFFNFLGSAISRITKGWFTDLNISNNLTVGGNTKIDKYLHLYPAINQNLANEFSDNGSLFVGGSSFFNQGSSIQSRQYGYGLIVQDYNIPGIINRTSDTGEFNGTTQYFCDYTTGFTQTDIDEKRVVVFGHDATYPLISSLDVLLNANCVELDISTSDILPDFNTSYYVMQSPTLYVTDGGHAHISIGEHDNSHFRISTSNGTGSDNVLIDDIAGANNRRSLGILTDSKDYTGVSGLNILMYSSVGVNRITSQALKLSGDAEGFNNSDLRFIDIDLISAGVNNTGIGINIEGSLTHIINQGAIQVLTSAWYDDTTTTINMTDYFTNTNNDATLFEHQNSYIYVGNSHNFTRIGVSLMSGASHTIIPEYYYCNSSGNWNTLNGITDDTDGFTKTGSIIFINPSDRGACNTEVDGTPFVDNTNYTYIAIKRTRNLLPTPPVENLISIGGGATHFFLDDDAIRLVPVASPPYVCSSAYQGASYVDSTIVAKLWCDGTNWIPYAGTEDVRNHNALSGLQGGDGINFYHFGAPDYTELHEWLDNVVLSSNGNTEINGNLTATNFFGTLNGNTSTWSRAGTNTFLTNSGDNVGIGTESPSRNLDVSGIIGVEDSGNEKIYLYASSTGADVVFIGGGGNVRFDTRPGGSGSYINTGNVGINTITPQNTLNVVGDINATGIIYTNYLKGNGGIAFGSNTINGLSSGDINVSTIYYDTLTAKSPIFQCSENWCSISFPQYQKTLWINKNENWTINELVYESQSYTKLEFWNTICQTNSITENICLKLNDKLNRLQTKYNCESTGNEWNGTCYETIKNIVSYEEAITITNIYNSTTTNYSCTQLNSELIPMETTCYNTIYTEEIIEKTYSFKDNCGWNETEGYYCFEKEMIL